MQHLDDTLTLGRVKEALRIVRPTASQCAGRDSAGWGSNRAERINQLWHIDTHQKLSRWGFYIHGGIDNHSRCVTFLGASDKSEATVMLELFRKGVRQYGLPRKVQADKGEENLLVKEYMATHRKSSRASISPMCDDEYSQ